MSKNNKLVVLDYENATVTTYTLPDGTKQSDDIEKWIENNTRHSSNIEWIAGDITSGGGLDFVA